MENKYTYTQYAGPGVPAEVVTAVIMVIPVTESYGWWAA
jgi:hypothetical protein